MIPFCKLNFGIEEEQAVIDCFRSGWVVQGAKTQKFEEKFAEYVGAKYCIFVDSCTSALDLALKSFNYQKQFEVAVPSLTFTSTAEVVVHNDLIPVFKDVNLKTFCMDDYEGGASIPVHLTGNKAKAPSLLYDSAHRIMRDDVKDSLSTWCYSFYATKNMTTIQGGMIATNDKNKYEWFKKARDHGISKGTTERYKDGAWAYSIDFVGWREKSDDCHAAIGLEQLKKLDWMNEERQRVVSRYNALLGLKRAGLHLFPILVNDRPKFIEYMKDNGVQTSVHFLPLHLMPAYKQYYHGESLPNTIYLGQHFVSLPLFPQLKDGEIDYISKLVLESGLFIDE